MARLVVSIQSRLLVLASDINVFNILGYHPNEINGQSLLCITGARSDPQMLQETILNMRGIKMQAILYHSDGEERRLILSCSPYLKGGSLVGSLVNLHQSEAVTLEHALAVFPLPRALVSADAPHDVHMTSESFLFEIGQERSQVMGRPLQHIFNLQGTELCSVPEGFGARQNAHPPAIVPNDLSAALSAALDGSVGRFALCHTRCMELAPVADAPNGPIRHILVTLRRALDPVQTWPSLPAIPSPNEPSPLPKARISATIRTPSVSAGAAPIAVNSELPRTTRAW